MKNNNKFVEYLQKTLLNLSIYFQILILYNQITV